jgi:hypothetical protein
MIRVCIGTEDAQWLPTQVLKFSITRRSKSEFEFTDLKDISLNLKIKMYTGFSFYRFYIPELCHYEGRAIYLDADIVVLCDLLEFIELDMKGKGVLARPMPPSHYFTSVMLMECPKLTHWKINDWSTLINAGIASYPETMSGGPQGLNHKDFGPLEPYWNHLDEWNPSTKIIHYTHVPTQPWKVAGHPFAWVFLKELKDALNEGIVTRAQVENEIAKKYIYPTILDDMDHLDISKQSI